MNNIAVFLISILDATALVPLNSEILLVYACQKKKYKFLKYIQYALVFYILPSLMGTVVAYSIGFFLKDVILQYINFILYKIFNTSILITEKTILTTLALKIFIPIVPISIINIISGIYHAHIWKFLIISFLLRLTRAMVLYNAVMYYKIVSQMLYLVYMGIYVFFFRIFAYMFYYCNFIQ